MMYRVDVDCRYIWHLLNERYMTIEGIILQIFYKEGVLYVDLKQLGVVTSVKMMYVWEIQFFV